MKKKAFALALTASLLLCPLTASAEEDAALDPGYVDPENDEAAAPANGDDLFEVEYTNDGYCKIKKFKPGASYSGPVDIPSKVGDYFVIDICNGAFMECSGVTSVSLPDDITDIGDNVFLGCTALESFSVAPGNPYFSVQDGILFGDNGEFLIAYPAAKAGDSYITPAGVNEIAPGAFGFAQNLKDVVISNGVTNIDNWAFAHSNIEKVHIAGTVEQIDDYAFSYCNNLSEVEFGHGLKKIYHAAFANDPALTHVALPATLELVGQYAFCGTGMQSVTIPRSVEDISYCAFGYDADFRAVPDFTVYGEANTMAQTYCTTADAENDYQNNFKFVAVEDADKPADGSAPVAEEIATEVVTADDGKEIAVPVIQEETGEPTLTEKLGAGLKGNTKVLVMLGVGGTVLIILACALIASFLKSPKRKAKRSAPKSAPKKKSDA